MDTVEQKILPSNHEFPPQIKIRRLSQRHAGDAVRHLTISKTQPSRKTLPIGIACHVSDQGRVEFVALANGDTVFCIAFNDKANIWDKIFLDLLASGGASVGDNDEPQCCLVGFSMARTAVQTYQAVRQRIQGVDLAVFGPTERGESMRASPIDIVLNSLSQTADRWQIARLWLGDKHSATGNVCLQAWLAACVGRRNHDKIRDSKIINTDFLTSSELECVGTMVMQSDIIESFKSTESLNDFNSVTLNKDGKAVIANARYKSRVRRSDNAQVIMTNKSGHEYVGNAQRAQGKRTTIDLHGCHRDLGEVTKVRVVGRQALTNSEKAREELIHHLLTGRKTLLDSLFIRTVWFPKLKEMKLRNPTFMLDHKFVDDITAQMKLNESQRSIVLGMVGDIPILVAHGPPGTGKTTTIAAASRIWDLKRHHVWIVAHSNVAVKNIGETLFKKEVDFKLLISKEFFDEWHEHLYEEILQRVIRSDELPKEVVDMEKMVGNSHIILCTLSMLSNPALQDNGTFKIVPVERLIVDEASQINIYEFMHIFKTFQQDLQKVCFFGDPEQLPPFGQDQVQSVQTIFDLPHITSSGGDFFLDTQYRMPVPVGNFISKEVYGHRLKSCHSITDPHCVKFINVSPPRAQEAKSGFSWTNAAEVITLVHLVKYYYKNTNFCIITPYDAQRAAIERALKAQNLPWESVYNLDSFQGNEADYLLISVVRTGSQPGFLTSRKRMNVLLTRCRKAAIIVTSRTFMALGGAQTLLGKMISYWGEVLKTTDLWVEWNLVADGRISLPDAPAPNGSTHYRETSYTDAPSMSSWTPTSTAWAVPPAYQGPSGGFHVGALFHTRTTSKSIPALSTDAESDQPNLSDEESFPPLVRILSKEPILKGSWRNFDTTSNTVHKHSLLHNTLKLKESNLSTANAAPPQQLRAISSASTAFDTSSNTIHEHPLMHKGLEGVSASAGKTVVKPRQSFASTASVQQQYVSVPVDITVDDMVGPNIMMRTNIYRRRR